MKEKFTKGPWSAEIIEDGDGLSGFSVLNSTSFTTMVCGYERVSRWEYVMLDDDEQKANAHLIAAAPEMYETLSLLKDFNCPDDYMSEDELNAFMAIDSILAKARGEQND